MYKVLIFLFFSNFLIAVDIGSDTSVTRFNSQQAVDDGDRIAGFTGLNAGFELVDSNVTAAFDSFFPVAGAIALNGGTLNLNQDLIMAEVGTLLSLGNINGVGHEIQLPPTESSIPSGVTTFCDGNIQFLTNLSFAPQGVTSTDWSINDQYIAIGLLANVVNSELFVYEFDGTNLIFTSSFNADVESIASVSWHPTKLILAAGRTQTPVSVGSELLMFTFSPTTGLSLVDTDTFGATVVGVDFHPTGDFLAVTSLLNSAEVSVYPVNSDGTLDKAGVVTFNIATNENPDIDSLDWDITGSFLAVGTNVGGSGDEVFVFEFQTAPSTSLTLNASFNAGRTRDVDWHPTFTTFLVTVGDVSPQMRLLEHDSVAGSLTQIASEVTGEITNAVNWHPNGSCIATGSNAVVGGEFRTFIFDSTALDFTLVDEFEFSNVVQTVEWSRAGQYIANGSLNDFFTLYEQAPTTDFIFSNLELFLNSNIELRDRTITFTGECLLHGQGNCLRLNPDVVIKIGNDSSLLIQDIRIEAMHDGKIIPLDNTSTLSFKDATLIFDGDYSFTQGRFDVLRDFKLEGNSHTFNYQSDQVSTVLATGVLSVGPGITFNYDPSIAANNLLSLAANSSTMLLNSATLSTTSTGLQLTKGKLIIEGDCTFNNQGDVAAEGIVWGDGISTENNLGVEWEPAANLDIVGQFVNKNI